MDSFLIYKTIAEYMNETNATGVTSILLYNNYIFPWTTPLLLFAFGCIAFFSLYTGEKAITGESNPFIALAAAMTFVMVISTIFALKKGLITPFVLIIVFIFWFISIVLLFLNRERNQL